MASEGSLKRLGGGRWETRDGRFAIEPQSGTWVVVDNTQTDDLGLPLVRGPFGSLTAAKEAIESARETGPAESPLADRLKKAREAPKTGTPAGGQATGRREKGSKASAGGRSAGSSKGVSAASDEGEPAPPPEPKWLRELSPADRRKARELIERLATLGIDDAETVARAEIARDEPAITRLALERAIAAAVKSARSPAGAGRAVVKAIMSGRDPELGARWRLVDERGRRIDDLEIPD
jgi:hypothetical protein